MTNLEISTPEAAVSSFITTHFGNDDACPNPVRGQLREWEVTYRLLQHFSGGAATEMKIIGHHTSKSIKLPVVRYNLANGVVITVRDNFHNKAISVSAPQPVKETLPLGMLFDKDGPDNSHHYFEGFERGNAEIYASYNANPRQFSCHVWTDEFFAILLAILATQPAVVQ